MPDLESSLSNLCKGKGNISLLADKPRFTRSDRIRHRLVALLYANYADMPLHELLTQAGFYWPEASAVIRTNPDWFVIIKPQHGEMRVRLAWVGPATIARAKARSQERGVA